MSFADAKVVLTGACGVFGRWIAAAFAREGAQLCLSDIRADALANLPASLGLVEGRYILHATELRDVGAMQELIDTVRERWRAPDILINNAGIYPSGLLLEVDVAEWDRIMDVNVRAPYVLSRGFAQLMIDANRPGSIINVSSGAARKMRASVVPYCVSKTALDRLTKGLAVELARYRIRVNAVEPGFAAGSEVSPLSQTHIHKTVANIPLGRQSGPDDAPNAIMFLCSERASMITGATLSVDGGNSAGTTAVYQDRSGGELHGT